jgi:hypothetical protein
MNRIVSALERRKFVLLPLVALITLFLFAASYPHREGISWPSSLGRGGAGAVGPEAVAGGVVSFAFIMYGLDSACLSVAAVTIKRSVGHAD